MERFTVVDIESVSKESVRNRCRLCGVENPDKVLIIDTTIDDDDEDEPLQNKIEQCVGIKVTLTDKMPQMVCVLCNDKIFDFFEFRLMCKATNIQTREALGLPIEETPARTVRFADSYSENKLDYDSESLLQEVKYLPKKEESKVGRKRKDTSASVAVSAKKAKCNLYCNICNEGCNNKNELDAHLLINHIPVVQKYGCLSCRIGFDTQKDYQSHLVWHSQSQTPYRCNNCKSAYHKVIPYTKHCNAQNCFKQEQHVMPDIKCKRCNKKFLTQNLYEWHPCFIKTKSACMKCGRFFAKKSAHFKHYVLCDEIFQENQDNYVKRTRGPNKKTKASNVDEMIIKTEPDMVLGMEEDNYDSIMDTAKSAQNVVGKSKTTSQKIEAMNNLLSTVGNAIAELSSGSKKKRRKKNKNSPEEVNAVIVKQEPNVVIENDDETGDADDYNDNGGDDYYDDYNGDSSDDDNDNTSGPAGMSISVKQENLSRGYADEPPPLFDPVLASNIKMEPGLSKGAPGSANKIVPKIKIKKEQGTLNASVINNTQPTAQKAKLFRNPLAVRIKQEKVDNNFPEAPPKASKQLQNPFSIRIKQEPLDAGYGDKVMKPTKNNSIRVNPLSIAPNNNNSLPKIISVAGQVDLGSIENNQLPMVQLGSNSTNSDVIVVKKELDVDVNSSPAESQRDETEDNEMGDEEFIRQDRLREEEEARKKKAASLQLLSVKLEPQDTVIDEVDEVEMGDEDLIQQDLLDQMKELEGASEHATSKQVTEKSDDQIHKPENVTTEMATTENSNAGDIEEVSEKSKVIDDLIESEQNQESDEEVPQSNHIENSSKNELLVSESTSNDEIDLDTLLKDKFDEISQSSNSNLVTSDQTLSDEINQYLDSETPNN